MNTNALALLWCKDFSSEFRLRKPSKITQDCKNLSPKNAKSEIGSPISLSQDSDLAPKGGPNAENHNQPWFFSTFCQNSKVYSWSSFTSDWGDQKSFRAGSIGAAPTCSRAHWRALSTRQGLNHGVEWVGWVALFRQILFDLRHFQNLFTGTTSLGALVTDPAIILRCLHEIVFAWN